MVLLCLKKWYKVKDDNQLFVRDAFVTSLKNVIDNNYHSDMVRPQGGLLKKALHHCLVVQEAVFVTGVDHIIVSFRRQVDVGRGTAHCPLLMFDQMFQLPPLLLRGAAGKSSQAGHQRFEAWQTETRHRIGLNK